MTDKVIRLVDGELVAEDPDTGEQEPVTFTTAAVSEMLKNATYDSIDDIPEDLEIEGVQVYTREDGLVVYEEDEQ